MATMVGAGNRRALQKRKVSRPLGEKRSSAFLEHLAATCNVMASAREVGIAPSSLYYRRRNNDAFAAAWHEAIQTGYDRLEEHYWRGR